MRDCLSRQIEALDLIPVRAGKSQVLHQRTKFEGVLVSDTARDFSFYQLGTTNGLDDLFDGREQLNKLFYGF